MSERERRGREFEETALIHLDSLFNTALYFTRDEDEAKELVQETCLRAYESFHQFRRGSNCKAWLITILHNLFINRVKGSRRLELNDDRLVNRVRDENLSPEEELIHKVRGEEIRRALYELPLSFREVVVLADMEGLSYKEISRILNCPMGTVMSRLHRGRRLLKEALKEWIAKD